MSITIDHLCFSYGSMPVLRDICAQASGGKITAVLGPNAAGKSTLLKCIIGALRAQSGHVIIEGIRVDQLRPRQLARLIAYVPQRATVAAAFTVRQVVELGRYALPVNPRAVDAAIDRLDLADVAERPYPKLSVGQQQRVTLARALAQIGSRNGHHHSDSAAPEPRTLILDEPTSAMDLQHVASTIQLLRELAAGGATIVLAMHDLSVAAAIADDVWLLDGGRLIAGGAAAEVLTAERLRQVFHVEFEWIDLPDGSRRLLTPVPVQGSPLGIG